jgi:hypothetical protein
MTHYAVDNSSGTWWEPATTDTQPTLTIELSPATRFDAVQLFTIDSVRLMFNGGRGFVGAACSASERTCDGHDSEALGQRVSIQDRSVIGWADVHHGPRPDEGRHLAKHDFRGNTSGEVPLCSIDLDELAPGHATGDYRVHRLWSTSRVFARGAADPGEFSVKQ